jgi:hypothetical protein
MEEEQGEGENDKDKDTARKISSLVVKAVKD